MDRCAEVIGKENLQFMQNDPQYVTIGNDCKKYKNIQKDSKVL